MVDFRKRLKKKVAPKKINPIEIYNSLDRHSETGPLRPSQDEILSEWYSNRINYKNNIVKLHTGEGKTLTGLLILQSKINSNEGPCLYICPNKYLAEQVKQEAVKFGIPTCEITDNNDLPDDFILGKKILITHVQKVFNGFTIFGLNNKSIDVGAVILDDSHACIDSIKDTFTIKVGNQHPLYKFVMELFEDELREQGEGSYLEILSGEYNTMLPIPYWSWYERKDELTRAIIGNKDDNQIKFVWPLIKNHIANCQALISGDALEITPHLMPIDSFGSFSNAAHRVLMSATTQDDSFFIKGLGFDIQSIENPLTNKNLLWSGEKMILIPSLISEDMDRNTIINWLCKENKDREFGIVSLVPSFNHKKQYEKIGAKVPTTNDLFDTVKLLKDGDFAQAIAFANRYDGIDLPDKSCRVLIIDSKPHFDSLLDRYEEDCRNDSDIMNIRIAQKVEQGLGRSVRGEKDYSIIILVGGDLIKFIKSPLTSKYFSNQTKKQIEIGVQIAEFAKEDSENEEPYKILVNLMRQSLNRDEGWKDYYSEEMNEIIDNELSGQIYKILKLEYQAEKQFILGNYDKACEISQNLCDEYNGNDSERGWYLQQLARYKYNVNKIDSNKIQKVAFQNNLQLLKPKDGINYKKLEFINQSRVARIKQWVSNFDNYQDMIISVDGILQDLSFGMRSEKFELALQQLGELIGFLSQRPDKEIKKGPDNLWCGVQNQYFLLECKNEVEDTRTEISKHEAGQMNSHSAWFESVYNDAKCKRILIIPTKKLSYHGNFTHDVEIMRKNGLRYLKKNVRNFFKEFSSYVINDISELKIQELINSNKLDIDSMLNEYSEKYIHSLS